MGIMVNEGIELSIYKHNDPKAATPAWVLPGIKSPSYLDEINNTGGGSFFVPRNDPKYVADPSVLDSRNVCKVRVNGNTIGAFLLGSRESTLVSQNERAGQGYLISGEGLKSWFDDAVVASRDGITQQTGDNRHFNFSAEAGDWYKPSSWVTPYVMAKVHADSPWTRYEPTDPMAKWPAAANNADWIWASPYGDPQNPAWCYFRWTVNITTPGKHAVYLAVDNHYVLYIDGQQIAKSGEGYFWHTIDRHEVTLSAGEHVIGIQARNRTPDEGYQGPAAVLASLFSLAGGTSEGAEKLVSYSAPTPAWKALPYPTVAPGWTIGEVLLKLLKEAKDRGVLFPNWVTPTFTSTTDSNGQPWPESTSWAFSVGESYGSVLDRLEEDYDIWIDPDTYQFNVVPTRGEVHDLNHAKPITFFLGKHLREAKTQAKGKIKNVLAIKTDQGWIEESDSASVAKYGRLEGAMTVDQGALAGSVARTVFEQRAQEEEGASYALTSFEYVPYVDFKVGDWVYAPNERGESVLRRVMSISVETASDTPTPVYTIEFDTIFRDNEERFNKVLSKLGGGGVGGGSSSGGGIIPGGGSGGVTLPPDTSPRTTTPKPPVVTTVESVGYWSANGVQPLSKVTVSWNPVTQNIDNSATIPELYEVWSKNSDTPDTAFELRGSTSDTTLELTGLVPRTKWEYKVRARNLDGGYSDYSNIVTEVMEGPNTALPAPNPPAVTSSNGLLVVNWDGLLSGSAPDPQFRYVFAEVATEVDQPYVQMGATLSREGRQITIPGLTIGEDYWVRLKAVDGMGLISGPSSEVSHIVSGVDLGDLDQSVTDAIQAAQDAADAASGLASSANTAASEAIADAATALATANNALSTVDGMITWSPSVPAVADGAGKPVDAVWYRTSANGIIGQWRWNGTAWTTSPIDSDAIYSINAVKITAGTLNAARIAAGSLSTSKLLITNLNNFIEDGSFEYHTTANPAWSLNSSAAVDTVNVRTGSKALKITTTAAAYQAARSVSAFQVEAGQQYRVEAWVRMDSGTMVPPGVTLRFAYGATEATTSTTSADVALSPEDTSTTYVLVSGVWVVPTGAKWARLDIVSRETVAGKVYRVDDISVYQMSTGELIVDGVITSEKVAADAIVGRHIQAESIATPHLQAQAITSEKVAAEAITAEKLAAGSVQTNHLTAGSVKTNHISSEVGTELNISNNNNIRLIVGPGGLIPNLRDDLNGTNADLEVMQQYYDFGPQGAVISKPGSVFATRIDNDSIDMLENGNVISYWNSGTLYVNQLVGERVTLGNHQIARLDAAIDPTSTIIRFMGQ